MMAQIFDELKKSYEASDHDLDAFIRSLKIVAYAMKKKHGADIDWLYEGALHHLKAKTKTYVQDKRIGLMAALLVATQEDLKKLQENIKLGLFIRSLVGLDREAAKKAFAEFQSDKHFSADQLEFLDLIINYLTENGVMEPSLLYESPFTDIDDMGVEGVFQPDQVTHLINILEEVSKRAAA